jgi:hypothetical protein
VQAAEINCPALGQQRVHETDITRQFRGAGLSFHKGASCILALPSTTDLVAPSSTGGPFGIECTAHGVELSDVRASGHGSATHRAPERDTPERG